MYRPSRWKCLKMQRRFKRYVTFLKISSLVSISKSRSRNPITNCSSRFGAGVYSSEDDMWWRCLPPDAENPTIEGPATQARISGNNPAETTGKLIAARFGHDIARPVDGYSAPQLHTHAVIFNVTAREDASTRALQPQSFFDSQNSATAVYQSALTYRLPNLEYEIEAGTCDAPEIKGYSQEYLDASSRRSRQIKDHLGRTGHSGTKAAQIAAHATGGRSCPPSRQVRQ